MGTETQKHDLINCEHYKDLHSLIEKLTFQTLAHLTEQNC